jgi:hypothetical protein
MAAAPGGIEHQFPHRQHFQPDVPEDADVELAALDVLLDDGVGVVALMDECHPLPELVVVFDDRGLRNAQRSFVHEALHDQRKVEPLRALYSFSPRKDGEPRNGEMVVGNQLLGKSLVPGEHHSARPASGVRNLHQLEEADHVVIEFRASEELLEQIEDDVRLPFVDDGADRSEFVAHAQGNRFMAELAQRGDHVVLGLPFVRIALAVAFQRVRRDESRMHQHHHPKFPFHSANQFRRP